MIDEDGGQLGVMQPFEAMKLARERGLDLVEISPTADPPVCKITDYGKYLYQLNKKAHEQRKSSRASQLKEVKFRPATAEHDYQVRKNQIIRFLGEGHKVRAMIFHRGREMAHQEVEKRCSGRKARRANGFQRPAVAVVGAIRPCRHSERSRPVFSSAFVPAKALACGCEESLFAVLRRLERKGKQFCRGVAGPAAASGLIKLSRGFT